MQSSIAHADRPRPLPAFVPPLDIARTLARQTLDRANALDLTTTRPAALAAELGGVCEALRQVLDALAAEERRDA
ncbi:hypothetical protein ACF1BS_04550 [Streptomyces sp. NPDC014748]|uniref:hypothetical protein n=1 Tax=Streptomyces sp. NPDC014748 TaxID=3364905 RepID=UPI0037019A93